MGQSLNFCLSQTSTLLCVAAFAAAVVCANVADAVTVAVSVSMAVAVAVVDAAAAVAVEL